MQSKKGLSDVVTTVLIVLLVLAAVAAVWAFINNLIQEGGSAINAAAQCQSLKVEPVACTISGTTATVTAQWTSGTLPTGASIAGITTTVVGGNGARTIGGATAPAVPASAGATTSGTVASITGGAPYSVVITPRITVGSETTTCSESAPRSCV